MTAKSNIVHGAFEFTGNVSEPVGALMLVEGQRFQLPIMLENANITVSASQSGLNITGSEGQKIYDQISALNMTIQQEQQKLMPEFQAANRGNSSKTK